MSIRLLVCGDRWWEDYDLVESTLKKIDRISRIEYLIEGGQKGADDCAFFAFLKMKGGHVLEFLPDWKQFGMSAGPIRNQKMLDEGNPDLVLAFHDDIERSRGTKDMASKAVRQKIPVFVISHNKRLKDEYGIEMWI